MTIDNHMDSIDDKGTLLVTEEQIALYLAGLLNEDAQQLTMQTTQRLEVARRLAVSELTRQQAQTLNHNGNVLRWLGGHLGDYWQQHRNMSAALILLLMLLTFFAAQQFEVDRSLQASDAFLLASDLPPEAYADKGFDTWLEANLN
jgi:DNA-binding phage protein